MRNNFDSYSKIHNNSGSFKLKYDSRGVNKQNECVIYSWQQIEEPAKSKIEGKKIKKEVKKSNSKQQIQNIQILRAGAIAALMEKDVLMEKMMLKQKENSWSQRQEELLEQIERCHKQLQELRQQKDDLQKQHKKKTVSLRQELQYKENQCIQLIQVVEEVQQAYKSIQEQISILKEKLLQVSMENEHLSNKLNSTQLTINALKESLRKQEEQSSIIFYNSEDISHIDNKWKEEEREVQEQVEDKPFHKFKQVDQILEFDQIDTAYEGKTQNWFQCEDKTKRQNLIKNSLQKSLKEISVMDENSIGPKDNNIWDGESQFTSHYFKYPFNLRPIGSQLNINLDSMKEEPEYKIETDLPLAQAKPKNEKRDRNWKMVPWLSTFLGGIAVGTGVVCAWIYFRGDRRSINECVNCEGRFL